jgi:hypothetical protein
MLFCINKQRRITFNIKQKDMSKQKKQWSLSIGTYPGILFGIRSYEEEGQTTHVFYLPLIDIALEVYK